MAELGPAGHQRSSDRARLAGPTSPARPAQRTAGSPTPQIDDPRSELLGTPPRHPGGSSEGWGWDVVTDRSGVTVDTLGGTVATARVSERGTEVVIEFWTASFGLPDRLSGQLIDRAFDHPAVRTGRPILVSLPRGDSEVLPQARLRINEPSAHGAGVTCLIKSMSAAANRFMRARGSSRSTDQGPLDQGRLAVPTEGRSCHAGTRP